MHLLSIDFFEAGIWVFRAVRDNLIPKRHISGESLLSLNMWYAKNYRTPAEIEAYSN